MKNVMACVIATAFLMSGAFDMFRQRRRTAILDEIVQFVRFVESELHFRSPDFYSLLDTAKKQGYRYLFFQNDKIITDKFCPSEIKTDFYRFTERIGTTDTYGQIALCQEYIERFTHILQEYKVKEKNNLQVNGALSVLGAVCVLVLFI